MLTFRSHSICFYAAAVVLGTLLPIGGIDVLAKTRNTQSQSSQNSLTPLQWEIEKQRTRLGSGDVEERRDAIMQLGSMHHPEAARLAASALRDPVAIVRATAAASILSLPAEESAPNLIPLLSDKDEFVRREAAYALGKTGSASASSALIERLLTDKKDEVRGAAAVALGQIKDAAAISSLSSVLDAQLAVKSSKKKEKRKKEQDVFVLRAAARSLGQIGSSAALPVLVRVLQDEKAETDVRREAASALGLIGDPAAIPALQGALTASDPYLVEAANNAIRNISRSRAATVR